MLSSAGFGLAQSGTAPDISDTQPAAHATLVAADPARSAGDTPELAPAPWALGDPADSLYRIAREALSRGDYKRAAEIFHRISERYPQSAYAGQALYYEAFALYRSGESDDLETALERLKSLTQRYPSVARGSDARSLITRVCGELAKRGDEDCTASIVESAEGSREAGERNAIRDRTRTATSCPSEDDDNDDRMIALSALLQMDADRAMPILEKVLARRDACSVGLRRKAVFLVSQKRTERTADILMSIARNDPDGEVREQAVFWLSQVGGARATDLLEGILKGGGDVNLRDKALFALSQQSEGRAPQILRDYALRESEPSELREKAIFWLGQRRNPENTAFLRALYGRLTDLDLREKVLFSLSQQKGAGNDRWLLDIALNPRENEELRKKALFWAGQSGVEIAELVRLYDRMESGEMKDQLIFVYSQRTRESAAVDKLFAIARTDRDPERRKKAIFWLGQSRDPRVQQFLMDLINK